MAEALYPYTDEISQQLDHELRHYLNPVGGDSEVILTLGASSYPVRNPDGSLALRLSPASAHRAQVAAHERIFSVYQPGQAIFSGGYPAKDRRPGHWPLGSDGELWTPPEDQLEGNQLAQPLRARMAASGRPASSIDRRVTSLTATSNTIGDVWACLKKKLINPDAKQDIVLVGGAQTRDTRRILELSGVNPKRIHRVPMREQYGMPGSEFSEPVSPLKGRLLEQAASAVRQAALQGVKKGDLDSLEEAAGRLDRIATGDRKALIHILRHHPASMATVALRTLVRW
jgi:hypothetical protein